MRAQVLLNKGGGSSYALSSGDKGDEKGNEDYGNFKNYHFYVPATQ